ncbi:MAG: peptide ABC transporter permease [Dehalococcoidia bacterium]|nr:MAG: peptide ABC transporter permease [Dehalococcoidia bacterium]
MGQSSVGPIIVRRLLWLPVLLMLISLTVFLFGTYGPGDPVLVRLGNKANPEAVERVREELGLNRPLHEQYLNYLGKVLQGDFGESYKYPGVAVTDLIASRLFVSLQLGVMTTLIVFAIGIPLGVITAALQGRAWDRIIVSLALIPESIPVFVLIPIVYFIFVRQLRWFPASGWDGIFSLNAILPLFVLSLGGVASVLRQTRTNTLEVLHNDYVRTARAKGLPSRTILFRHVLRNSLLPLWTAVGFIIASLPAGSIIVEGLMGIPGIGELAWNAIFQRDYPVIMAITLLGATLYVIGNLIVDIGYPLIDPRIRY